MEAKVVWVKRDLMIKNFRENFNELFCNFYKVKLIKKGAFYIDNVNILAEQRFCQEIQHRIAQYDHFDLLIKSNCRVSNV